MMDYTPEQQAQLLKTIDDHLAELKKNKTWIEKLLPYNTRVKIAMFVLDTLNISMAGIFDRYTQTVIGLIYKQTKLNTTKDEALYQLNEKIVDISVGTMSSMDNQKVLKNK